MQSTSFYSYKSIQPDEIRVCRFVHDGDYISALLEIFPIDGSLPQYNALSYTWRTAEMGPNKGWTIKIGDHHLPVLDSLRSFFQVLRSKGTLLDSTWWWIDSICIDQTNAFERDENVRRMKDIFQRAQEVIIWLGDQSDDSDYALDFIHVLDGMNEARYSIGDMRMILQNDQYQAVWTALEHFFLRKWWTRIWTIQEFVIPSRISFWCGPRYISIDRIFGALTVVDRCNLPGFKDTIAFRHVWNRRRVWVLYKLVNKSGEDQTLSLLALAAYFCMNEATDDRDRLYGLTGLSTENHALNINYSWSVDEVYLRFAQSFIAQHLSLDIISFASLFVTTSGSSLPSWAPDWRTTIEPLVVPSMTSQSSTSFVGNLRPPKSLKHGDRSTRYSASGSRAAIFRFEGLTLLARGIVIDDVDGLGGSRGFELIQSSEQLQQSSHPAYSPTGCLTSVCRSLVLDREDRYLGLPMPAKSFFHDFIHLCLLLLSESCDLVQKEFQEWFISTRLLRIRGYSLEDLLRDVQNGGTDTDVYSAPNQDEYIQDSFYGRFFDTVKRMSMRLMTSRNGRIGTVTRNAMKGDLICILFGCSVPVLLRRVKQQDQFTVVGECFLDGCMNGEVLNQCGSFERTFAIM